MKEKRDKTKLAETLIKLNKQFGKGSVQMLGEKPDMDIEVVSTGSVGLDLALGVGGLPYGRIVEILGEESSGKTTMAIHVISEGQAEGAICAFIDVEHAFDKAYAEKLGVNVDELLISQPDYGEQALEIAENLISSGGVDIVVIDSVAALTPLKEIEGEMGDQSMGLQARMMGQALRKLVATVSRNNVLLIFINQWREKIGVMFGDNRKPTGGNALKFYASVRMEVSRSTTEANSITEGDEKVGNLTKVKVFKNKVAPPFRTCEFDILYGIGIWKEGEILQLAVDKGIVVKSGGNHTFKEVKLGASKDKTLEFLAQDPDTLEKIKQELLK